MKPIIYPENGGYEPMTDMAVYEDLKQFVREQPEDSIAPALANLINTMLYADDATAFEVAAITMIFAIGRILHDRQCRTSFQVSPFRSPGAPPLDAETEPEAVPPGTTLH